MGSDLIIQVLNNKNSKSEDLYHIAEKAFEYQSPWTLEQFKSIIEQPFIIVVIAKKDDEIIGFIIGRALTVEAEIYNIAVDNKYQQQGVGSKLMSEFKRNLFINQILDVFLQVSRTERKSQSTSIMYVTIRSATRRLNRRQFLIPQVCRQ